MSFKLHPSPEYVIVIILSHNRVKFNLLWQHMRVHKRTVELLLRQKMLLTKKEYKYIQI